MVTFASGVASVLALFGVFVFGLRLTCSTLRTAGATAFLASSAVVLEWLTRGSTPRWPASLACLSWMIAVAGPAAGPPLVAGYRVRFALAALLGAGGCALNPAIAAAVAAAAVMIGLAEHRRGPTPPAPLISALAIAAISLSPL